MSIRFDNSNAKDDIINKVNHREKDNKYVLPSSPSVESFLSYDRIQIDDDGDAVVVDLYHTEVPEVDRGKGYGAALAEYAIRDLASQSSVKEIRLSCSYLAAFYSKNKDRRFSDLSAKVSILPEN